MNCPKCGSPLPAGDQPCPACGARLVAGPPPTRDNPFGEPMVTAPQLVQPSYNPGDDAGMRLLLPIGRSGWAIVSGYLGLLSLALCFLGPFAIITGVMAIRAIRKDPSLHGMGRAVFGIVGGVLGFVGFVALIVSLSLRG